MKKIYCFVSTLLILCLMLSGCGTVQSSSSQQPNSFVNTTAPDSQTSSSEEVTPTPEPKKSTVTSGQKYADSEREIRFLGLKEYNELESDIYTDKPANGKKYLVLFLLIHNGECNPRCLDQ